MQMTGVCRSAEWQTKTRKCSATVCVSKSCTARNPCRDIATLACRGDCNQHHVFVDEASRQRRTSQHQHLNNLDQQVKAIAACLAATAVSLYIPSSSVAADTMYDGHAIRPVTIVENLPILNVDMALSSGLALKAPPLSANASGGSYADVSRPELLEYCEPEALGKALARFHGDVDQGYGGAQQATAVMSYYRRLGCSQAQLDAALTSAFGESSSQTDFNDDDRPVPLVSTIEQLPWQTYVAESIGAAALVALIRGIQDRPVGWVRKDLVETRPSEIAGTGLFAKVDIERGTSIGAYPGRLRTPVEMQQKVARVPGAAQYTFVTTDQMYIDPTDMKGEPSQWPVPGWPWPLPCSTELAYANEPPPKAGGTNCFVEDGSTPHELLFVANRDIEAGEEIFIDYGSAKQSSTIVIITGRGMSQVSVPGHQAPYP